MSIKIGGIDIADTVINMEFRLGIMERVIDKMAATSVIPTLSSKELEQIRTQVMQDLQKKYPDAGIRPKN